MSIRTEAELAGMRRVGRVVAGTLAHLKKHLRVGITTAELDAIAAEFLALHGARPAPAMFVAYPAAICISINEEAVHGLPGPRKIAGGDLVKLDVAAELDGFVADAACTIVLEPMKVEHQRLAFCAES